MITRSAVIEVELSPYELAQAFCEMDADKQALVLTHIVQLSSEWDKPFEFQVQAIVDSKNFLNGANKLMKIFGEYAK